MVIEATDYEMKSYHSFRLSPWKGQHKRKVWIVELGYGADTRYDEKFEEKQQQHTRLVSLLESRGFHVIVLPIILGVGGTIFHTVEDSLRQLGIAGARVKTTMQNLHRHSVQALQNIVRQRRILEAPRGRGSGRRFGRTQTFDPP